MGDCVKEMKKRLSAGNPKQRMKRRNETNLQIKNRTRNCYATPIYILGFEGFALPTVTENFESYNQLTRTEHACRRQHTSLVLFLIYLLHIGVVAKYGWSPGNRTYFV